MKKRRERQHDAESDQASPATTPKANNASTAATEKTPNANKGTAEEGRVPEIPNGSKRPGCKQVNQRKRKRGGAKANVGEGDAARGQKKQRERPTRGGAPKDGGRGKSPR